MQKLGEKSVSLRDSTGKKESTRGSARFSMRSTKKSSAGSTTSEQPLDGEDELPAGKDLSSAVKSALGKAREGREGLTSSTAARSSVAARQWKELKQELKESKVAELYRSRKWAALTGHLKKAARKLAESKTQQAVAETRDRHSVISVAAPLGLDLEDNYHIRDHQAGQIFFNAVLADLIATALWVNTETTHCEEVEAEGGARRLTRGALLRRLAKGGSSGGGPKDAGSSECDPGSLKILTLLITGLFTACALLLTVLISRAVFRWGNRGLYMERERLGAARYYAAWGLSFVFFAVASWSLVAFGRCMTSDEMETMLVGWAIGCAVSWLLMEPLWVGLIVCAPCLCNNPTMQWINDRANDLGCDLALLVG